ncbi:hypothetical protein PFICI_04186 [Pestalotiopsis fici W106-1]|uniref:Membrane insertase YidC/Oxa/ALB C-terminal domain-containing protein n=1 Tax=Pestalotiopsis fici (strain W106-1 / CGMCC3.15140) TaxID=1229662 RepID=W3XLM3_PESFW|nr:uncharacterized protein PFICI_04186 [Pestalotiopsis fici W106-1]ETS86161.1 hypothetical protein PFICI_04186 [Pestalotiopsis fici W106-1]
MLPSRGLSISRPVAGLRQSIPRPRQTISSWQTATRQYSQIQRFGRSSQPWSPSSGALLGHSSALPRLSSVSRNSLRLGATAGASRSLSLWPFGSSQQISESKNASSATSSAAQTGLSNETTTSASPLSSPEPHFAEHTTGSPDVFESSADPAASSFSPELFSDLESASILDIPEQIGYLKHLGLDFGWGPTAMCEWLLEHIYIYTGLPWWASIAAAAFGVRLLMFYPTVIAQQHSSKLALLHKDPEFVKASAEAKEVMWDKDVDTMQRMKVQARVQAITKRAGVSYSKTFLPPLAVIPFSYGMFRLLRGMAALPVPSLETGGFAWITDLTVYDPTYILPLASAALSALTMVQHQKANLNPTPQSESMAKFMLYGLTPFMFVATMWFPAAVQWFFFVFALSTVTQGTATLNPMIRRLVGLPAIPGKSASISPTGVQYQAPSRGGIRGMMDGATQNMTNLQKGIEDYTGGPAKAALKKAQDYEKKRAQEEREKAMNRMLENQRKRMSRRN